MTQITLHLDGGNTKAGAKSWAKTVRKIDPSHADGWGLGGEFLNLAYNKRDDTKSFSGDLPEGSFVLLGGSGGSWKNQSRSYCLCRVAAGAEFKFDRFYQHFSGTGLEIVTSNREKDQPSGDEADALMARFPSLKHTQDDLWTVYAALLQAGLPIVELMDPSQRPRPLT